MRAGARWRPGPGEADKGTKTELFKLMKARGRNRLTSSIWSQALEQGDQLATELIDGRSGRWAPESRRRSTCSTSRP